MSTIIGAQLDNYRIVEKLGEGGMGVVYKAEDVKLNRQVALNFLAEHLLSDGEAKERFLREAQAAAALSKALESADLNFRGYTWTQYDVSADGQRFIMTTPVTQESEGARPHIRIVRNWFEEFRNRQQ